MRFTTETRLTQIRKTLTPGRNCRVRERTALCGRSWRPWGSAFKNFFSSSLTVWQNKLDRLFPASFSGYSWHLRIRPGYFPTELGNVKLWYAPALPLQVLEMPEKPIRDKDYIILTKRQWRRKKRYIRMTPGRSPRTTCPRSSRTSDSLQAARDP